MSKNSTTWFIAKRYLFSPKRRNAINLVSIVAALGVMVATLALVCVLSVFNGFEKVVSNSFCLFDPMLKIEANNGGAFSTNNPQILQALQHSSIEVYSCQFEQQALAKYNEYQMPVNVIGVDNHFKELVEVDSILLWGYWKVREATCYAVASYGVSQTLNLGYELTDPLELYVPKRKARVNIARPDNSFKKGNLFLSAVFAVRQERYDGSCVIIPIDLLRQLYDYEPQMVTSIHLKLQDTQKVSKVEKQLQQIVGDDFKVLNRKEQQKDYYRIMRIEKYLTFLILAFILLIATCNIIGSLSMLQIEKQADIRTLSNLGADDTMLQRIFLYEGWLIAIIGAVVGIVLGVIICVLQQYFGFIKMSASPLADAYPVVVKVTDVIVVFATVVVLGFLAARYPAKYASHLTEKQ